MSEKKELVKYQVGNALKIKFAGGGELPRELSGSYTSHPEADYAIARYLKKRDGEGDAKTKTRSRSKSVQ